MYFLFLLFNNLPQAGKQYKLALWHSHLQHQPRAPGLPRHCNRMHHAWDEKSVKPAATKVLCIRGVDRPGQRTLSSKTTCLCTSLSLGSMGSPGSHGYLPHSRDVTSADLLFTAMVPRQPISSSQPHRQISSQPWHRISQSPPHSHDTTSASLLLKATTPHQPISSSKPHHISQSPPQSRNATSANLLLTAMTPCQPISSQPQCHVSNLLTAMTPRQPISSSQPWQPICSLQPWRHVSRSLHNFGAMTVSLYNVWRHNCLNWSGLCSSWSSGQTDAI